MGETAVTFESDIREQESGFEILGVKEVPKTTKFKQLDMDGLRRQCEIEAVCLGPGDEEGTSEFGVTVRFRSGRQARILSKFQVSVSGQASEDAIRNHFLGQLGEGKFDSEIRDMVESKAKHSLRRGRGRGRRRSEGQ